MTWLIWLTVLWSIWGIGWIAWKTPSPGAYPPSSGCTMRDYLWAGPVAWSILLLLLAMGWWRNVSKPKKLTGKQVREEYGLYDGKWLPCQCRYLCEGQCTHPTMKGLEDLVDTKCIKVGQNPVPCSLFVDELYDALVGYTWFR